MSIDYIGLKEINGPLIVIDGVDDFCYEELVKVTLPGGETRLGKVITAEKNCATVQVFEGTEGIGLSGAKVRFTGSPMSLPVSKSILGRVFDGLGRPVDGLGPIIPEDKRDINGMPINPVSRAYPHDCIQTGISSIDGLCTLIKGQKLPIFSGAGMPHNELAFQIASLSSIAGGNYAIIFCAMGVKNDVAAYFKNSFEKSGALQRVAMFLNLANDPVTERIAAPRCALTAAEYLAYDCGMDVLVIMTDMTSYAEALREASSAMGEIPARKGYPGYLYSNLASLYERAGMIKGKPGSVTQIPILTMPNDDITHPVPDLTGYITEGQIVLDRDLESKGVYPPFSVLSSLSRLMKDGIGEKYTREDHSAVSNQLYASYATAADARALAGVVGEEDLSDTDKKYLEFADIFEKHFLRQSVGENRSFDLTLDLGWEILSTLPRTELDRIDNDVLDKYYGKISTGILTDE